MAYTLEKVVETTERVNGQVLLVQQKHDDSHYTEEVTLNFIFEKNTRNDVDNDKENIESELTPVKELILSQKWRRLRPKWHADYTKCQMSNEFDKVNPMKLINPNEKRSFHMWLIGDFDVVPQPINVEIQTASVD